MADDQKMVTGFLALISSILVFDKNQKPLKTILAPDTKKPFSDRLPCSNQPTRIE